MLFPQLVCTQWASNPLDYPRVLDKITVHFSAVKTSNPDIYASQNLCLIVAALYAVPVVLGSPGWVEVDHGCLVFDVLQVENLFPLTNIERHVNDASHK